MPTGVAGLSGSDQARTSAQQRKMGAPSSLPLMLEALSRSPPTDTAAHSLTHRCRNSRHRRLVEIAELKDLGLITPEEYNQKRAQIVAAL